MPTKDKVVSKGTNATSSEMQAKFISATRYSGPIPAANEFAQYEEVLPGSADRILKMAENQAAHRQKLESKALNTDADNSKRGQIFAFIIAMTVIVGGLILLAIGKSIEGYVALIAALASLVGTFIYSKISERKERIEKNK